MDNVSQGTQSVTIGSGMSVYGTGTYGSATYSGAGRRQFYKILPITADGRTFSLRITYTGQEQWKLYNYHVGLVPETKSRGFSE